MQSKLGPSWSRFHHLLVALLRRHASTLASTSQATPFSSEELPDKDTSSILRDICRNLIAYCRVLSEQSIAGPLSPASSFTLVFAPSFRTSTSDSAMITDEGIAHTTPPTSPLISVPNSPDNERPHPHAAVPPGVPGLDVLANLLTRCLSLYDERLELLKSARLRYANITEIPLSELTEV